MPLLARLSPPGARGAPGTTGHLPGAGTSGRGRILIEAVRYQPQRILYAYGPDDVRYVISGRPGPGSGGLLVVMAGLAGTGRITGRVAAGYAGAAGIVLVLVAGAALVLTRAISRPLREVAELAESAGQAAAGGPACDAAPRRARGQRQQPLAGRHDAHDNVRAATCESHG